jgi:Holliday junction resolvase RusA-like endonuclease
VSIIHFTVPGRPFAWKRTNEFKGRRITDKGQLADQRRIAQLGAEAWGPNPPLFGPVKLLVIATFETPASWPAKLREAAIRGDVYFDSDPDFDNIAKEAADGLKFVAFCDDNQVGDGRAILRYGLGERREIWMEALGDPSLQTPAAKRREAKWRAGGYDAAIADAPCGAARWPRVLDALRKEAARG